MSSWIEPARSRVLGLPISAEPRQAHASRRAAQPEVDALGAYWLIGLGVVGAALAAVFGVLDWLTGYIALSVVALLLLVGLRLAGRDADLPLRRASAAGASDPASRQSWRPTKSMSI